MDFTLDVIAWMWLFLTFMTKDVGIFYYLYNLTTLWIPMMSYLPLPASCQSKKGCGLVLHHHAKCLQIVLLPLVGVLESLVSGQNGLSCTLCWSPHDTTPLWCCTWPSINTQMKGSPWRSPELSWPICHANVSAPRDPKWPPAASACQTAANLVFGDVREGRGGEVGGRWAAATKEGGEQDTPLPSFSNPD